MRLVTLPVVGTGKGGAAHESGKVLEALLPLLLEFQAERESLGLPAVDLAIVAKKRRVFVAAQRIRAQLEVDPWAAMPDTQRRRLEEQARFLGEKALKGNLTLFLGAGIGFNAGLPLWKELLASLGEAAGLKDPEMQALMEMGHLDAASLLEHRLQSKACGGIGIAVAEVLRGDIYSLQHALLASLPVKQVVTTNYDDRFEKARRCAEAPLSVIPHKRLRAASGWVLKMHGDISFPDEIVLSRDHYMYYDNSRAALSAVVQAMLITKYMLFVGFSLSDYNFHKIVSSVRAGFPSTQKSIGSAVVLIKDKFLDELWNQDVNLLHMLETGSLSVGARILEIFLDRLASYAIDMSEFLMDPKFGQQLSFPDKCFVHLVQSLQEIPPGCKGHPVEKLMFDFACELGYSLRLQDDEQERFAVFGPEPLLLHNQKSEAFPMEISPLDRPDQRGLMSRIHSDDFRNSDSEGLDNFNGEDSGRCHVFIARGDIRTLACDAWLVPSGSLSMPDEYKYPATKSMFKAGVKTAFPSCARVEPKTKLQQMLYPSSWGDANFRIIEVVDWPKDRGIPYSTLGGICGNFDSLLESIKQFLYAFYGSYVCNSRQRTSKLPLHDRTHHLVALPVLGTGSGGFRGHTGLVVSEILKLLDLAVVEYGFDVVLVCYDDPTYVTAQIARLKLFRNPWSNLDDHLQNIARDIAQMALDDQIVLFFAGQGATQLFPGLEGAWVELAKIFNLSTAEIEQLMELSTYDRSKFFISKMKNSQPSKFYDLFASLFFSDEIQLFHFLLSQIPSSAMITTNIDQQHERCLSLIDQKVALLCQGSITPEEELSQGTGSQRWLMKINGCRSNPSKMNISKEQMTRSKSQRSALSAILQSLLITKHIFFVGSALDDRQFHRALDEVLKIKNCEWTDQTLCTLVTPKYNQIIQNIWQPQVRCLSLGDAAVSNKNLRERYGLRKMEILLDCIGSLTMDRSVPILDERFSSILSNEERLFREHLLDCLDKANSCFAKSCAFPALERFLKKLGARQDQIGRKFI